MKAEELRLGNIINFPFIGSDVEVIGIPLPSEGKLRIQTKLNNNTFFELPAKYKPILLKEMWIIKLGFKSIQDGWYEYSNSNITFSWNIYDRQLRFLGEPFNIQYVHQLQNLYFALTGEELEVKQ